MKKLIYLAASLAIVLSSCSKDDDSKWFGGNTSEGQTLILQGGTGGKDAVNTVYVDLSEEQQQSVVRASWHLGFNCTSSFGVILNNTQGSRAIEAAAGVTVATAISNADSIAYAASLSLNMGEGTGTWSLVDSYDGDLSKTVIKEDKVYIYDSGESGLELYKVSVAKRDANSYTLSYAPWNSTTVKTVEVVKKADYNVVGVSLVSGAVVDIQPEKKMWDIVWGRVIYTSAMNPDMPFVMSDIVYVNSKNGVQTAQIVIAEGGDAQAYENYTYGDVASTEFSSVIDVIGSAWRVSKVDMATTPAVASVAAAVDRFYVIKDTDGNVYKLRFNSASSVDGGKRGEPEIEYALVEALN